MSASIENFIKEYNDIHSFLIENGQISSAVELNAHYRKILLLSCASYYETRIVNMLQSFTYRASKDSKLCFFLKNKAIKRQYHTYFSWKENNINSFLGLFGPEFKTKISSEIKDNPDLSAQVKAFLTIGSERNLMVHENFMEYRLEKTFEEIATLHNSAIKLIEYLEKEFKIDDE